MRPLRKGLFITAEDNDSASGKCQPEAATRIFQKAEEELVVLKRLYFKAWGGALVCTRRIYHFLTFCLISLRDGGVFIDLTLLTYIIILKSPNS